MVVILPLVAAFGLSWVLAVRAEQRERGLAEEAQARAEAAKRLADQAQREAAGKVAPLPQRHFLEKGKSYFFVWQENFGPAVVLEEPRDGWVKVQTSYDTQWINLSTVHRVRPAPEAKGGKDADKGAVEGKGTVRGVVNVNGKPVEKGEVRFYSEQPVVIVMIKDGRFEVVLPPGVMRVTIKGDGVLEKYGDKETTPFKVEVIQGQNQFDFNLPR